MSGNQQSQGQQNPLSAFSKPDTTPPAHNNQGGGFGALSLTPPVFGNTTQSNATNPSGTNTAPKPPLFGGGGFSLPQNQSQSTQQAAPSGSSGGIFGSSSGSNLLTPNANTTPPGGQPGNSFRSNSASSGGGLFSGNSSTNMNNASTLFGGVMKQPSTPSTQPNPLFGGSNIPAVPSPSGGPFGSQTNNQTPSASGTSGSQSTTGNTSTPSLSIFGSASNSQNIASGQSANAPATAGTAAPPSTSNPLFGNTASSTSSGNVLSQPSPFSAFGGAKSTATSTPASTAPALPSLFGGNNASTVNKGQASTGDATSSTPSSGAPSLFSNLPKKPEGSATPSVPSGFSGFPSLAAPKDSNKETRKEDKSATSGPSSSNGQIKESAAGKDAPSGPSPFAAFSLGGAKSAATTKTSDVPGTATSGPIAAASTPVPAPSMLRGKTVEDIVNRWTNELETHTREFSQFASEVAVWDRTLIENGNYISALYATVLAAESTQASLDQSLDHVEQQQRHLNATLDQYEKSASEILHGPGGIMSSTEGLGLADSERDKSYALAANLYTQLDDLSRSLTQMVESVNSLNLSPGPSQGSGTGGDGTQDDAISIIAGILNSHLSSLQWIDGSLKEMEAKVKDAERKIKDIGVREGIRNHADDETSKSRGFSLGSSRR